MVLQVDPRLGDFGMADGNLHALSNFLRKPSLSVFRGHVGSEHGYSKPFPRKNEPPRDVALPGMDGVILLIMEEQSAWPGKVVEDAVLQEDWRIGLYEVFMLSLRLSHTFVRIISPADLIRLWRKHQ